VNREELDDLLRRASVPERPPEYWDQFPQEVASRLSQRRAVAVEQNETPARAFRSAMDWRIGFAVAALVTAFLLGVLWKDGRQPVVPDDQIARSEALLREFATLFPNRIRAITIDTNGVQLVLSENADVPSSTPFLINICKERQCRTFITFSGQQIQISGEMFEVLSDARGEIILVGQQSLWISGESAPLEGGFQVRAQALEVVL
jgi:hypothetical protein